MDNIKTLKEDLQNLGFKFAPPPFRDTGVDWYAWKRLDGVKDCQCNDKPPSLIITPHRITLTNKVHSSAVFSVTGELPNNQWVQYEAYGVSIDVVVARLPQCEALLRKVWNVSFSVVS